MNEIHKLKRALGIMTAERDFLQRRLDSIKAKRIDLVLLLKTPTMAERTAAGIEATDLLKAMGEE